LPLDGKPNALQMAFIYEYYPEYGGETNFRPLFASLRTNAESWEIQNKPYSKPAKAKKQKQEEYYGGELSSEEEGGFGAKNVKKGSKVAAKKV